MPPPRTGNGAPRRERPASTPAPVVPKQGRSVIAEMGGVAVAQATETQEVLRHRDPEQARRLLRSEPVVDESHRRLFMPTQSEDWPHGVQAAVDVTLLGRFYLHLLVDDPRAPPPCG